MVPLPGGAADKAGNSYERRWTVLQMLRLLDGSASEIRVEVPGEGGVGAEFRIRRSDGLSEWHQAKRQRTGGPWTVANLIAQEVVQPWWSKLQAGERVVFVTSTGCQELQELTTRSRDAESWPEFFTAFLGRLDSDSESSIYRQFERLRASWGGSQRETYEALQNIQVSIVDDAHIQELTLEKLRGYLEGGPEAVYALLGQLADESVHRTVDAALLYAALAENDIHPRHASNTAAERPAYHSVIRIIMRRTPSLRNRESELGQLRAIATGDPSYELIVGSPWAGKNGFGC